MLRVLILGADEFIGGRLMLALASSDWAQPVVAQATQVDARHPRIVSARFDTADAASLDAVVQGVDAVVNCLSGKPATIVQAAEALFACAARRNPMPLIVHVSSMSVYGPVEGEVREDAPLRGDLGAYAQAKVRAENIAAGYARKVILRPGCEYGPQGELWSGRIARWLFARRVGDLGAAGDGYCNLVHIDDLVEAIVLALRRPEAVGQTFNLAMSEPPTWNEYFIRYARALGAVPVKRVARRALVLETKLLAAPLKVLQIGAGKLGLGELPPPPIPPSLLKLMSQEIRLNSSRAGQTLGWRCRPLDQGLAQTAAWYAGARGLDHSSMAGADVPRAGSR